MNIRVGEDGLVTLSKVFNPIVILNGIGERISICQRDDRFEILVVDEMERADGLRLLHIIDHRTVEEHNAPGANRVLP